MHDGTIWIVSIDNINTGINVHDSTIRSVSIDNIINGSMYMVEQFGFH